MSVSPTFLGQMDTLSDSRLNGKMAEQNTYSYPHNARMVLTNPQEDEEDDDTSTIELGMFRDRIQRTSCDPLDKRFTKEPQAPSNGKIISHPWSVRTDGRDYYIHFPYDEAFLEKLKRTVPAARRWWDKYQKEWRIDPDWIERVKTILQAHFG